jgi:hypothetical protein
MPYAALPSASDKTPTLFWRKNDSMACIESSFTLLFVFIWFPFETCKVCFIFELLLACEVCAAVLPLHYRHKILLKNIKNKNYCQTKKKKKLLAGD